MRTETVALLGQVSAAFSYLPTFVIVTVLWLSGSHGI